MKEYKKVADFFVKKNLDFSHEIDFSFDVLSFLLPLKPDESTIETILIWRPYINKLIDDHEIEKTFGDEVLSLLSQVKKLFEINFAENDTSAQVEVLKKMFFAMAKDLRVIFIVLALKVVQMRKMAESSSSEERKLIADEVLNLYVPVASRLGIYGLKTELEDLAFKYTKEAEYQNIVDQLLKFGKSREDVIFVIEKQLQDFLKSKGYDAQIYGRLKTVYGIYRKFKRKNLNSVDDLFDIFAIRVILPSKYTEDGNEDVSHLYKVLGLVHSIWKPISKCFKDYIAVPKPNGYRSLHTVVLGLSPKELDRPVEIQIRSAAMHEEAEYGVAAHWIYKEDKSSRGADLQSHVEWLKGLSKIQEDLWEKSESLKGVEIDVFKDRIFVLTPRGEVKDLPLGATCLDFAYAVHTDIGNKCVMAKINGVVVPLDYELENGQVVEILTKNDSIPKLQWLSIVKTNFARNKIRAYFGSFDKEQNIKEGKRLINEHLARLNKPLLDQSYSILKNFFNERSTVAKREELLEEVGRGHLLPADIIRKIYPYEEILAERPVKGLKTFSADEVAQNFENFSKQLLLGGESGLPIKIAKCCLPVLGDNVVGYITRGKAVSVHRKNCSKLYGLDHKRFLEATWKNKFAGHENKKYRVKLRVSLVKRIGLIRDITSVISSFGIVIIDLAMKHGDEKVHDDVFVLELDNFDKFDVLLDKLERVPGVIRVIRED